MKIFKTKKYSILSSISKFSFVFVIAFTLLFTNIVRADPTTGTESNGPSTGTGTNVTVKIANPLGEKGPQNIPDFIRAIINIVLVIGVPIVTLAIIYTGFLFVKAQGNSEQITKAKSALMYTLIGAALLLGAWVLAEAIKATVDQIKS